MSGAVSEDIREEFKKSAVQEGITFVEVDRDQPLSEVTVTLPHIHLLLSASVHPYTCFICNSFLRVVFPSNQIIQ